METYSVLTRLTPRHRASPTVVTAFLRQRFRHPPLTLPARAWSLLLGQAEEEGITGGAIYDALVAATARRGAMDEQRAGGRCGAFAGCRSGEPREGVRGHTGGRSLPEH